MRHSPRRRAAPSLTPRRARRGRALAGIVLLLVACAHRQGAGPSEPPAAPQGDAGPPSPRAPAPGAAQPEGAPEAASEADDLSSPDRDFDGDGIPDRDDACPTEPEVYDGGRDDDGCPGAAEA